MVRSLLFIVIGSFSLGAFAQMLPPNFALNSAFVMETCDQNWNCTPSTPVPLYNSVELSSCVADSQGNSYCSGSVDVTASAGGDIVAGEVEVIYQPAKGYSLALQIVDQQGLCQTDSTMILSGSAVTDALMLQGQMIKGTAQNGSAVTYVPMLYVGPIGATPGPFAKALKSRTQH